MAVTPSEPVAEFLRAAIRAPSSHNTQPWLFRVRADAVELHADRIRALPVNDPHDRELVLSGGCALMNLRVAAEAAGFAAEVERLPDRGDPDHLATVHLSLASPGRPTAETGALASLRASIEARRTWRRRFRESPVPGEAQRALETAALAEGVRWVPLLTDDRRYRVAELVYAGDAVQWASPAWRRELAAWMHPRRRGDGLTVPGLALPAAQQVVRTFDMGGGVGARDRDLAEGSPLLALLETEEDGVLDWLRAGEALERVLLEGVRHGLQASFLNQPVQVPSIRPRLRDFLGLAGHPQVILRFGVPDGEVRPSPRRPLEAFLALDPGPPFGEG